MRFRCILCCHLRRLLIHVEIDACIESSYSNRILIRCWIWRIIVISIDGTCCCLCEKWCVRCWINGNLIFGSICWYNVCGYFRKIPLRSSRELNRYIVCWRPCLSARRLRILFYLDLFKRSNSLLRRCFKWLMIC